jgi:predicted branched-subunit amino acid permease
MLDSVEHVARGGDPGEPVLPIGGDDPNGFLLGCGLVIWLAWLTAVVVGHVAGEWVRLPPGHALYFASIACFVSILVSLWRGPARDATPWLFAAGLALVRPFAALAGVRSR